MTIRLRTDSDKCLYEQIYEHIKKEIRDGKLLAGGRLPSTRSLAEYLQVARSTVEYAYGQLLDEGYIESRPYKGYYVCSMEGLLSVEEMQARERETNIGTGKAGLQNGTDISETVRSRAAVRTQMREGKEYEYNFSPYAIDMSGFPFSVWKKLTGKVLNDANRELFSKGQAQGDYALRETISRYLHVSRGVNCTPEQVIVGAGNDYLLLLLEKILGRQVKVAMENPTYTRSYKLFQSFGYEIAEIGMDENGMKASELERISAREKREAMQEGNPEEPKEQAAVWAAYVMPSHQFPVGTVMPIGRRLELLRWAYGASDRYLIEDDYDSEFRFYGKPIPALQASDEQGKVIYMSSFSKTIAPAIRISFMVLPKRLLERYQQECSFYSCTVSRIDQGILNEFVRDGYFERHLNKMRKLYRAKHDFLLELLRPLEKHFLISGENAGLHILMTARSDVTEQELIDRAAKEGVKIYGISECRMAGDFGRRQMIRSGEKEITSDARASVLLGFGGMTKEQIEEGVKHLIKAWL